MASAHVVKDDTPLLEMRGISKGYPGVQALDSVDFDLRAGEVHALLGENGAGKSTLMKILAGTVQPDRGSIVIAGRPVGAITPNRTHEFGIGMVYQELSLVPTLSVAENIFLGRWPAARGRVRWEAMQRAAQEVLERLDARFSPRRIVRTLSVAEQQLVEIAKALAADVRILLLDEPTSALARKEIERLFDLIRRLKAQGVGIAYVSHRLGEVLELSDRITVLRDGRRIATLPTREVDEAQIVRMMVGRELRAQYPKEPVERGDVVLRVEDLATETGLEGIRFEVRAGEVVGFFGAMGAGRSELARALFGLDRITGGRLYVNGRQVEIGSPADAIRAGIGYLPEDRRQGLVLQLAIPPNVTLASLDRVSRQGFLSARRETELAATAVRELRIATPGLSQRVANLSGGNQQKVALARWIIGQSRILILDEPTRGIDVGAKAEVYALINQLAGRGVGVLVMSSELPEVLGVTDRILVMRRGRIVTEFTQGSADAEAVLRAAIGSEVQHR